MNVSTRFTVALHILTLCASARGRLLTSQRMAGSVKTNPVVIRRVLGLLRKHGFVTSRPGNHGGWELSRDPEWITLADVRRAVHEGSPFSMHSHPPNPACRVGRNIQSALGTIYVRAERAMEDELARTTVMSLLRSVRAKER